MYHLQVARFMDRLPKMGKTALGLRQLEI